MVKLLKKNSIYYTLLLSVMISGFGVFLSLANNPQLQMITVVLLSFFYVGFAVLHHYLTNDLSVKVVIEYVLMAALGITLVYFYLT